MSNIFDRMRGCRRRQMKTEESPPSKQPSVEQQLGRAHKNSSERRCRPGRTSHHDKPSTLQHKGPQCRRSARKRLRYSPNQEGNSLDRSYSLDQEDAIVPLNLEESHVELGKDGICDEEHETDIQALPLGSIEAGSVVNVSPGPVSLDDGHDAANESSDMVMPDLLVSYSSDHSKPKVALKSNESTPDPPVLDRMDVAHLPRSSSRKVTTTFLKLATTPQNSRIQNQRSRVSQSSTKTLKESKKAEKQQNQKAAMLNKENSPSIRLTRAKTSSANSSPSTDQGNVHQDVKEPLGLCKDLHSQNLKTGEESQDFYAAILALNHNQISSASPLQTTHSSQDRSAVFGEKELSAVNSCSNIRGAGEKGISMPDSFKVKLPASNQIKGETLSSLLARGVEEEIASSTLASSVMKENIGQSFCTQTSSCTIKCKKEQLSSNTPNTVKLLPKQNVCSGQNECAIWVSDCSKTVLQGECTLLGNASDDTADDKLCNGSLPDNQSEILIKDSLKNEQGKEPECDKETTVEFVNAKPETLGEMFVKDEGQNIFLCDELPASTMIESEIYNDDPFRQSSDVGDMNASDNKEEAIPDPHLVSSGVVTSESSTLNSNFSPTVTPLDTYQMFAAPSSNSMFTTVTPLGGVLIDPLKNASEPAPYQPAILSHVFEMQALQRQAIGVQKPKKRGRKRRRPKHGIDEEMERAFLLQNMYCQQQNEYMATMFSRQEQSTSKTKTLAKADTNGNPASTISACKTAKTDCKVDEGPAKKEQLGDCSGIQNTANLPFILPKSAARYPMNPEAAFCQYPPAVIQVSFDPRMHPNDFIMNPASGQPDLSTPYHPESTSSKGNSSAGQEQTSTGAGTDTKEQPLCDLQEKTSDYEFMLETSRSFLKESGSGDAASTPARPKQLSWWELQDIQDALIALLGDDYDPCIPDPAETLAYCGAELLKDDLLRMEFIFFCEQYMNYLMAMSQYPCLPGPMGDLIGYPCRDLASFTTPLSHPHPPPPPHPPYGNPQGWCPPDMAYVFDGESFIPVAVSSDPYGNLYAHHPQQW